MIELSYKGAVPKYIQIKEGLISLLEHNAFLPGEKLPPVKELASRLAVNPKNLKCAYDELAQEGYIYYENDEVYVARKGENHDKGE